MDAIEREYRYLYGVHKRDGDEKSARFIAEWAKEKHGIDVTVSLSKRLEELNEATTPDSTESRS